MQQFTLAELWAHMGLFARLVVYVLAIMSGASLLIMAERLISYLKSNRDSRRFAGKLAGVLQDAGIGEASKTQVGKDVGHLGRVLSAGLGAYRTTTTAAASNDLTIESVARALERQAQREQQNLKRGLNLLATVGSTAPFVGLLGTVVGIINAIPAVMAYNYMQGWVDARMVDMTESSNELLDVVARQLDPNAARAG